MQAGTRLHQWEWRSAPLQQGEGKDLPDDPCSGRVGIHRWYRMARDTQLSRRAALPASGEGLAMVMLQFGLSEPPPTPLFGRGAARAGVGGRVLPDRGQGAEDAACGVAAAGCLDKGEAWERAAFYPGPLCLLRASCFLRPCEVFDGRVKAGLALHPPFPHLQQKDL